MPFDASPAEQNPKLQNTSHQQPSPAAFDAVLSDVFAAFKLRTVSVRLMQVLIRLSEGQTVFEASNREIALAACGNSMSTGKIRYWLKVVEEWGKANDVLLVRRTEIGHWVKGKSSLTGYEKSRYEWAGLDPIVRAYYAGDLDWMERAASALLDHAPRWRPNDRTEYPSEATRMKRSRRSVETQLKKIVRFDVEQGKEPGQFMDDLRKIADLETSKIHFSAAEKEFCRNFEAKLRAAQSNPNTDPYCDEGFRVSGRVGGGQKTTPYNQYPGERRMNGYEEGGGPKIGKVPNRNGTTTENGEKERLTIALGYADEGIYIFPCHTSIKIGERFVCSCSQGPGCPSPGKHPLNRRGLSGATVNRLQIKKWWKRWPNANIAIATGHKSGILVLDVDSRHGGFHSLDELEDDYKTLFRDSFMSLSETAVSRTGGGGLHFYFRCPEVVRVRGSAGKIRQGLDIKGEGGFVIAPGSTHKSGKKYEWNGIGVEIGPAPDWLVYEALQSDKPNRPQTREPSESTVETARLIPVGSRNSTLFRWACGLINSHDFMQVREMVLERNFKGTARPLANAEVESILKSVKRYVRKPGWQTVSVRS